MIDPLKFDQCGYCHFCEARTVTVSFDITDDVAVEVCSICIDEMRAKFFAWIQLNLGRTRSEAI